MQRSSTHLQCFIMQRLFVSYRKPSWRQQFQEKTVFSLLYHKCINYGKIQAAGGSLGTLFKAAASVLDTLLCLICKIQRSDSENFFFVGHFTVDYQSRLFSLFEEPSFLPSPSSFAMSLPLVYDHKSL